MLKKLGDAIRGQELPAVVPGMLRPIDVDLVAKELKLKAYGTERGAKERPATIEDELDQVERTIIQRIESEWSWNGDQVLKELAAYYERANRFSVGAEVVRLRLLAHNAIARLVAANHEAEADLGPLKDRFVSTREEYDSFRAKHRLSRPPRNPARPLTAWALLIFLIGVESVLNGVFFGAGSNFGLIGGVVTAVGISGLNVLFSFVLGLSPARWINHRNYLFKLTGLVVVVAGLCALAILHAFAAHFREAMAADEQAAFAVAVSSLWSTPFEIKDLNSIYLFALGVLFSLASFWKGYRLYDPYPGYSAQSHRLEVARENYSDEHRELFDELDGTKEQAVDELEAGIRMLPNYPEEVNRIRALQQARLGQFKGYETNIETAANQLLAVYREANRDARKSNTPSYFSNAWKLRHSFLDSAQSMIIAPSATEEKIGKETLMELRSLADDVLKKYESLLAHYPHPTKMTRPE